ncbi:MAG TPA: MFS transporter, partial [Legionellaceae bacterium]|nr:MFS transporter [Legionellaceae bacterium]
SSTLISLVFIGLGVASPLFAMISQRIKNRLYLMFYSTLCSALALIMVIYIHPMPIWLLGSMLFLFGFNLGAFPMVFVIGKESNPLFLAGTVISLINASDAFFDAITEPLIGAFLDIFGHSSLHHDFSLSAYQWALGILPLYQIIGTVLLKWVKDDHDIRKLSS